MSLERERVRGPDRPLTLASGSLPRTLLRYLSLATIDAFALWFLSQLYGDGNYYLLAVIAGITIGINLIFLKPNLYPLQWLSPGIALMILMVVYPLIFSIYTAFTNYDSGHLLTKKQAIQNIEAEQYLPPDAPVYAWTAFRSNEGEFALWLTSEGGEHFFATTDSFTQPSPGKDRFGPLDEDGNPTSIEGFERLTPKETVQNVTELSNLSFGSGVNRFSISSLTKAAQYQQKYTYNPSEDLFLDNETGVTYRPQNGNFVAEDGERLFPGFQINVGWKNFSRLFSSAALRGPLLQVFLWTLAFAILSVFISFSLGLFLALVFHNSRLPVWMRKGIRSVLLIPYVIPFFLSMLVWRGMFNEHIGIINRLTESLFSWSAPWFSDEWWARTAIILINVWLSYPYMMLISTGALQSIPQDLFEVAEVDGASTWQKFWNITLPILFVSVGPLLVFSFAGAFNNFAIIYLYNFGGPPIAGTTTPAGHTDILISYVYNLAFAGFEANYGYGAAISIIIFMVIAVITLVQFKYTNMWEEVSRNV